MTASKETMTIHDYTVEFLRPADQNNLRETEDQQVSILMNGLKPSIQDKRGLQVIYTFEHAQNLAMKTKDIGKQASNLCFYHRNQVD